MVEVEVSLLEAKLGGGVEGDVLCARLRGCGFKGLGLICSTRIGFFFICRFRKAFESAFWGPQARLGFLLGTF